MKEFEIDVDLANKMKDSCIQQVAGLVSYLSLDTESDMTPSEIFQELLETILDISALTAAHPSGSLYQAQHALENVREKHGLVRREVNLPDFE